MRHFSSECYRHANYEKHAFLVIFTIDISSTIDLQATKMQVHSRGSESTKKLFGWGKKIFFFSVKSGPNGM